MQYFNLETFKLAKYVLIYVGMNFGFCRIDLHYMFFQA